MTLEDVAKAAKVSPVTARRALRNEPTVRAYLRERVMQAAKELQYRPNLVARGLRQKQSNLVSVAVPSLDNPFFGSLLTHLIDELEKYNLEPVIAHSFDKMLEHRHSYQSCGCISVCNIVEENIDTLKAFERAVTVQAFNPEKSVCPDVSIDFSSPYRKLTDLAIKTGRKKFIFVYETEFVRSHENKFKAVEDELAQNGLSPVKSYLDGFLGIDDFAGFLAKDPTAVDAIFCENDYVAARCLPALSSASLVPGRDVQLIGCDATIDIPGMWSIKIDAGEIAEIAVRLFLKSCSSRWDINNVSLDPLVIV